MGKTLHKLPMIKEFIKNGGGDFTDWRELEEQMKDYVADNDIHIPSGRNGNYVTNNTQGSMKRTRELLDENPDLRRQIERMMENNRKKQGMDPTIPGGKGGRIGGKDHGRIEGTPGPGRTFDWDEDDWDPTPGPRPKPWNPIGGGRDRRDPYRERKSLRDILFSPLGVVLAVIAVCIFLYEVVGPAAYAFIMDGPFFKILLMILAGAAVVAILKSARGWPSGVKFVVILVIGLVLLYSVVGPAIYAFLMSGILFKLICLVIAVAAVVGILKADMGWPIGVKIVVIIVILAVLKSEVF